MWFNLNMWKTSTGPEKCVHGINQFLGCSDNWLISFPSQSRKILKKRTVSLLIFLFCLSVFLFGSFFKKKNSCRIRVLFVGPLIPLFWTSGDVFPGFQSQGGFPRLCGSLPAYNEFLRFTFGATPADLFSLAHLISVCNSSLYLSKLIWFLN